MRSACPDVLSLYLTVPRNPADPRGLPADADDPYIPAYHLSRGDFSRWITGTLADHTLARQLAAIERDLSQRHAAALERARHQIMHAIDSRYPGNAGDQDDT